ncbi:MAG: response regulator transcription factor [Kiritimatiellae bacterium]|nr:response regulator transcription factor [Kiritimatiellia bacterium]
MKATVFIVDDHSLVRQGLGLIINQEEDLEVGGGAGDEAEALAAMMKQQPDVAVIDLSLKGGSGLDLIKAIRERGWTFPILVLSMHDEALYAERALRAGANGYIMKEQADEAVLDGLRTVLKGELFVSREVQSRMLQQYIGGQKELSGVETLSDRELQVFELIGQGLSTQQIADRLELSVKTIEAHRVRIKKKLNTDTASQLMQQAVLWVDEHR